MKKILFACIITCSTFLFSCEQRIEMDMSQWGDHAYIDNVEIIKLETDDEVKLQEYYQNETPLAVTGVRNITISNGTATIDSANFVATVKLKSGEDLKYAGFRIHHKGTLVEPINGTPKAGIVTDLSAKEFTYRISSADGSKHDWKIVIE